MKRIACVLILLFLAGIGTACGVQPVAEPQPLEPIAEEELAVPTKETETVRLEKTEETETIQLEKYEETPIRAGDYLLLSVSKITFSVVGESEDIYLGTAPRDRILWESDNEAVAVIDQGRLTAVGVGTAVIHASFGGETQSCTVECLAENTEELMKLDSSVLRSPKRIPPVLDFDPTQYYSDSAIIGDSITWMFYQHERAENYLGHPKFLCRGGVSLNGFVRNYRNLLYRGNETHIEDLIAVHGVKKIFILLGQNDLGYKTVQETLDNYATILDRIRQKSPYIQVYIQTCLPEWCKESDSNAKNEKIDRFNEMLVSFAEEQNCRLIQLAPYFKDHLNRMATDYTSDYSIHMNTNGSVMWSRVLTVFAYMEERNMIQ